MSVASLSDVSAAICRTTFEKEYHPMTQFLNKLFDGVFYAVGITLAMGIIYCVGRIFIIDQFVIPSDSMTPTLQVGDRVWVNKLLCGARIYDDIDSINNSTLHSWRTRGIRKIERNDILIFNFPINEKKKSITFMPSAASHCPATA